MLPPDTKHHTVLFQERLPFITARCSHFSLCQVAKLLNVFCRTEKNLLRQLYVAFKVPKEWVANFQLLTFGIKWAMPDLSWFFWGSFRIDIFPFPCLLFKYHGVFHKCLLIDQILQTLPSIAEKFSWATVMSAALNSVKFAIEGHKGKDRVKLRYGGGYSLSVQKLFSSHKYLPMHLSCGQLRKYNFLSYHRLD